MSLRNLTLPQVVTLADAACAGRVYRGAPCGSLRIPHARWQPVDALRKAGLLQRTEHPRVFAITDAGLRQIEKAMS